MSKNIHLTTKELKDLLKMQERKRKKKKKTRKKKSKDEIIFKPIKHNPNMRDFVTSSFPNSGSSVLAREIDVLRGELNKKSNKLIADSKTDPKTDSKPNSYFHILANQLTDETITGSRNLKQNKDGSVTISKPLISQSSKKQSKKTFDVNDGLGEFEKSRFSRKTTVKQPSMTQLVQSRSNKSVINEQPKTTVYIPTGDNVDVSSSQWNQIEELDDNETIEEIDEFESVESVEIDDVKDDVKDDENDDVKEDVKPKPKFECDICGKTLSSKSSLKNHKHKIHKK